MRSTRAQLVQAAVDLLPVVVVGRGHLLGGPAEERRQRGERARAGPRSGRSSASQQPQPLLRAVAVPNTLPAPLMTAGTPTSSSASRTSAACGVRAHEHGDVPGPTVRPSSPVGERYRRARRQQPHDVGGDVVGDVLARAPRLRVALLASAPTAARALHDADAQRRGGRARRAGAARGCARPPATVAVDDARRGRAARRRTARRRRRCSPWSLRQFVASVCARRRPRRAAAEVGVDVGAAEGVDRLLRVADQHAASPSPVAERAAHDVPLDGSVSWNSSTSTTL